MKIIEYKSGEDFMYEAELEPGDAEPCPFCGQDDAMEIVNTWTASYWIRCDCGAEMHGGHAYELVADQNAVFGDETRIDFCEKAHRMAAQWALRQWNERGQICDELLLDPIFEEIVVAAKAHQRARERGIMGSDPEPSAEDAEDIVYGLLEYAAGADAAGAKHEYREKMVEVTAVAIAAAKAHGAEAEQ